MSGVVEIETPSGLARAEVRSASEPRAALVLGHGAGGGTGAPDLLAATEAALEACITVALVEQPYRVAGRRTPAPASHLDAAWVAVVEQLRSDSLAELPLVCGGRSSGARVACRTAAACGAAAVLCLAFPEHPPGRPDKSRQGEIDAVEVPMLLVQGDRDPFGMPAGGPGREVVVVKGNHSLRGDLETVRSAVAEWLQGFAL